MSETTKMLPVSGRCHRAWAAPFLVRAGWRVILDGVEVAVAEAQLGERA